MDSYRHIRQIGKGSFGRVLLVEEEYSRTQYVIKQVNTANMTQLEQQKVLREVALLSDLDHPSIVFYRVNSVREIISLK